MKLLKYLFTFLLVLGLFLGIFVPINKYPSYFVTSAEEDESVEDSEEQISEDSSKYNELKEKIDRLENKLNELEQQEKSLKNEIESLNNQIDLTEYQIQRANVQIRQKQKEIEFLQEDIKFLKNRLKKLKESINYQEELVDKRIREKYKNGRINPLNVFLASTGFSDLMKLVKYSELAEEQDKDLLSDMKVTQDSYENQQDIIKDKKQKVEAVKAQIEQEKKESEQLRAKLSDLKSQKNRLLEVTQNDEEKYQDLLRAAKLEMKAIQQAVYIAPGEEGTEVEQGDVIGYVGNTGCSTGPHLHFEIRKDDVPQNPGDYLGDDDWSYPLGEDFSLTQSFGENLVRGLYGPGGHPGWDMVKTYGGGDPIRAVADGTAYSRLEANPCYLTGTRGKGVVVVHDDDYKSVYWHLR